MRLFKNFNVKFKLVTPVVVMSLLTVISSATNYQGLTRLNSNSLEISDNYAASLNQVKSINTEFQELRALMYSHIVSTDDTTSASIETQINNVYSEIASLISDFESSLDKGTDEEKIYSTFKSQFDEVSDVANEVLELSRANKDEEASELASTTFADESEEVSLILSNLEDYELGAMQDAVDNNQSVFKLVSNIGNVIMIIVIIFGGAVILVCECEMIRPLKKSITELEEIVDTIDKNNGNLTKRLTVDSKDEIGRLAVATNKFIETLQNVVKQIKSSSFSLDCIVEDVSTNLDGVNGNACDISASMEELSASMEEVSATTSQVSDNTVEIGTSAEQIKNNSTELAYYTEDMKKRAEELENKAVSNKDNASKVISEATLSLEKAIKDAESVDRVNELTEDILSIASQTNLLSLNASIEAARAGEAGQGFAVVANEIRQLADSSKTTAENIQNINSTIIQAVKTLSKHSQDIMKFVNETVIPDYESFVESGKQYSEDATHIDETVEQFEEKSKALNELVSNIVEAMQGISSAVEESTNAITNSATNVNDLVDQLGKVSEQMDKNKSIAEELSNETNKFTSI
jgi:methyl-accepting chemotaxis protein